jgi:putative endonuclease
MLKFFNKRGAEKAANAKPLNQKAALGSRGERLAGIYLEKKGYRIIERNFRGRYGEVDIIARQGKVLVFVEVKTRSANAIATPKEAVDFRKAARIIKASQEYLLKKGCIEDTSIRFDVIGIILSEGAKPVFEHIEAAFDAE